MMQEEVVSHFVCAFPHFRLPMMIPRQEMEVQLALPRRWHCFCHYYSRPLHWLMRLQLKVLLPQWLNQMTASPATCS